VPRFSVRLIFGVTALVAVVCAWWSWKIQCETVAKKRHAAELRLSLVGATLEHYTAANGRLPLETSSTASGTAQKSWRVLLCEDDRAWPYSPRDCFPDISPGPPPKLRRGEIFQWPTGAATKGSPAVFAVRGPGTVFDLPRINQWDDLPYDVIVVLEVADSKTHWMQPGDYSVTDLLAYRGRIGDHLHGLLSDRVHVLFADGRVWALDPNAPIADLQPFLTITGAKSHDRDQLLAPHKVD
jgi:hypothetical protein